VRGIRVAFVLVLVGGLWASASARAESPEAEVERLAAEAVNAYKSADYKRAVELLQKAYEIRQVPALLYNLAKAYDKLGDIDHAYDTYRLYADSAAADPKLKARAEARVALLGEARRKKAAEARAAEAPAPPVEARPAPAEPPGPPPPSPEELRQRAHDGFVRDRHRARLITIVVGGGAVVFAAVALGLSVNALSLEQQFNKTTLPDPKSRLKSDAQLQAGVADGFWCAAAVTAGVAGYYAYRSFRRERPAPAVALVPVAAPTVAGLAVVGSF
jgi:tetratricopeptide (TPR) repeat protein